MDTTCLEFRRAALLDPRRLDAPALQHAERCALCRQFLAREIDFEHRLEDALRVPVPDGIVERMAGIGTGKPRVSRRHALAAGLALVATGGIAWLWKRNDPLALAGIEFVINEEDAALARAERPEAAAWRLAAARYGLSPSEQLGELRYFGTSDFQGARTYHAVIKNCYGKVTLLISGGTPAARGGASAHGLEALIAPIRRGNLVMVAASTRAIACAQANLRAA